tara:strand:+ start:1754 stop:2338 length:585 start_codon:yes stop_codon:yes gene_type:complete
MGKEYTTDALEVSGAFCDYNNDPGTAGQLLERRTQDLSSQWISRPSPVYLKTKLVDTTLSNISSYSVTACLNTTPEFSSGGASVTSSSAITVTEAGIYKVTAMVQADGDSARSNLTMTVGVNGVFNQAVAAMGYVRNIVGAEESSTTWTGILFIGTNSVLNLAFLNTTNTRITSVIIGAKSSVTLYRVSSSFIE